jgi:hypothetical protein
MTHIHDIGARPVPSEPQVKKGSFRYAVYGVSLVVAALNVVASVNLYRSTAEMRAIDQRLSELAAFERRLVQKIDGMNNGIQSQFDRVSDRIQARSEEPGQAVADSPDTSRELDDGVPAWKKLTTENIQTDYSKFILVQNTVGDQTGSGRAETFDEGMKYNEASYERIVSADGKIYYKKNY